MNGDQEELTSRQHEDLHVLRDLWGAGWESGITEQDREDVAEMLHHGQHAA